MSDKTKYKLAGSIKECMRTTPADSITIRQITENCGLTRQTFYRNFLDKYDLINWYFDRLLAESFEDMGKSETVYDGLVRKFDYIRKERVLFAAAFRSDGQNSLKEHDFEAIFDFYLDLIKTKTGAFPEGEIRQLLEIYCRASVYMTVKWVLGGMKESSKELAHTMLDAMPPHIAKLFDELGILT